MFLGSDIGLGLILTLNPGTNPLSITDVFFTEYGEIHSVLVDVDHGVSYWATRAPENGQSPAGTISPDSLLIRSSYSIRLFTRTIGGFSSSAGSAGHSSRNIGRQFRSHDIAWILFGSHVSCHHSSMGNQACRFDFGIEFLLSDSIQIVETTRPAAVACREIPDTGIISPLLETLSSAAAGVLLSWNARLNSIAKMDLGVTIRIYVQVNKFVFYFILITLFQLCKQLHPILAQ